MSIDRAAYSDPAVFDEEMARIFGARMYVGSTFDFPVTNDYRSLLVGNRAITIRNTPEGIRAFNNVCLHRNALIDPFGSGNRPFRCGYHGWSYADDGALKHAPAADMKNICERQLAKYPIAKADAFYFVGTNNVPELSGVDVALKEAEIVISKPFHEEILDHACNWKLLVENVVESQHLSHVHTNTFIPAGFTSTATYECGESGIATWGKLTPVLKHNRTKAVQRISKDARHHFSHVYIFPDLFISNTNSLIGYRGNLLPTAPTATRLVWSLFELPAMLRLPGSVRKQIREDAIKFSRVTLLEDKAIIEACQAGLIAKGCGVQLQENEVRILGFHKKYRERMTNVFG